MSTLEFVFFLEHGWPTVLFRLEMFHDNLWFSSDSVGCPSFGLKFCSEKYVHRNFFFDKSQNLTSGFVQFADQTWSLIGSDISDALTKSNLVLFRLQSHSQNLTSDVDSDFSSLKKPKYWFVQPSFKLTNPSLWFVQTPLKLSKPNLIGMFKLQ